MGKSNMDRLAKLFVEKEVEVGIEKLPMKEYIEVQKLAGKMLEILEKKDE